MTIEVRQIVIRSTVGGPPPTMTAEPTPPPAAGWVEQLRHELLEQCRALLALERERANER